MKKKLLMILLVMALGVSSAATAFAAPTSRISAQAKVTRPTATQVAAAVKKAYGDSYLPNYKLDKSAIKDLTGISSTWYSSAYVEMPMISTNVDTIMIFKGKNVESRKKIYAKITAYRKGLINDTMQYPMNKLKIQASRVYRYGNYVCFIMLGQISSSVEEHGSDDDIIKAYRAQNQIAVNAIKKKLAQ